MLGEGLLGRAPLGLLPALRGLRDVLDPFHLRLERVLTLLGLGCFCVKLCFSDLGILLVVHQALFHCPLGCLDLSLTVEPALRLSLGLLIVELLGAERSRAGLGVGIPLLVLVFVRLLEGLVAERRQRAFLEARHLRRFLLADLPVLQHCGFAGRGLLLLGGLQRVLLVLRLLRGQLLGLRPLRGLFLVDLRPEGRGLARRECPRCGLGLGLAQAGIQEALLLCGLLLLVGLLLFQALLLLPHVPQFRLLRGLDWGGLRL